MNSQDLLKVLQQPELLQKESRDSLKRITKKYPYFFIGYVLLAKQSVQKNGVTANQDLSLASLYSSDREKLYEFMESAKKIHPISEEKKLNPAAVKSSSDAGDDEDELHQILRSIHERKRAILEHGEDKAIREEEKTPVKHESESPFELSSPDSEFGFHQMAVEEENTQQEVMPHSGEIEVINHLEAEFLEQIEFEETEDFLMFNEIAGGGAEYVPTEFLNSEDDREDFLIERDAEIQSIGVIDEEFILHDLDIDYREKEVKEISVIESIHPIESEQAIYSEDENLDAAEIISVKNIEDEGLSTELSEKPEVVIDSERDSPGDLNIISPEQPSESLRINENVESPGEFLPEKSYTYSQWLRFFKYDKITEASSRQSVKKAAPEKKPDETRFQKNVQDELDSIDRIVSSLKKNNENDNLFISAEDLAHKSSELDDSIVSETLAGIYEEQGMLEKAIRQYVKLSLKYPGKVSFFAARIRELKNKK